MIDIAVIGAGNRARKYLSCLPDGVRVCCLVEPEPLRLELAARQCAVPPEGCYSSSEAFFAVEHPGIQAVIVAAPDRLHVPLSLLSINRGWHVLLEKPVAPSEAEYRMLMDAAAAVGVHVGVCLEMRFHPYFRRIREIVESGAIGDVVSVDHVEHIGPDRMAHTFVRGLWSRRQDAGPIFLSKCCHDADFLLSLVGGTVEDVTSEGRIGKFHAPALRPIPVEAGQEGNPPLRCIDCSLKDCLYSAVHLYRERREWVSGFDVPDGSTLEEVIETELREGRYGRCVYHCDNNVYDTQGVTARLSNGIQLSMALEGITTREGRTIIIHGTAGTLEADDARITVTPATPEETSFHGLTVESVRKAFTEDYSALSHEPLHAGADRLLVEDFFTAIAEGREPSATLASAFEGHRLCYLAD